MSLASNYQKTIDYFAKELSGIQSWRASSALVDNIVVSLEYGSMSLSQMTSITIPDAQTIRIEPRDKSTLPAIESAIYKTNTWLTPSNQGDYLYIKIPPLTEETRKATAKQVSQLWEEMKIRIRQTRQDELKLIKKDFENDELSEDQKVGRERQVDETTKEFTSIIDTMIKDKQKEVMSM